jgi:hypothetical protein
MSHRLGFEMGVRHVRHSTFATGVIGCWIGPAELTTPLHTTLKRALVIAGREYVVTLTHDALKLTLKGKRNGLEIKWASLVDGDAALAVALRASVGAFDKPTPNTNAETTKARRPMAKAKSKRAKRSR